MSAQTIPTETYSQRRSGKSFWRCFWITTLIVSVSYAVYCFYVPSNRIVWTEEFAAARQHATELNRPMILYFTAQWCVPCRIMKRQVWADDDVATIINEQFVPVMVDLGDSADADVVERYNVRGTPVTIVTDPAGNTREWRAGRLGKAEFLSWLDHLTRVETNNPN